jgi:hypothetical protein
MLLMMCIEGADSVSRRGRITLHTVDLTPRIGTKIKADAATLLSGDHDVAMAVLLQRREAGILYRTTIEALAGA